MTFTIQKKSKEICNFINADVFEIIKFGCEFDTNGKDIINVKVLEKIIFEGEEVNITGISLMVETFISNLQNAENAIFNKTLFLLNDSYTVNYKYDFTITGYLMKSKKVFNYTELLLTVSFLSENETEKKIKNVNCTILDLNQSECKLKCEPNESLNGEILKGFSYMTDSILAVFFKENENKVKVQPKKKKNK